MSAPARLHAGSFAGVLFFPVTAFDTRGRVDAGQVRAHVADGVENGAGAVFAACGTGEFHALDTDEKAAVAALAVGATNARVPVIAGTGGSLGDAILTARK